MNGTIKAPKWALYHKTQFWLTDTCAGGSWSEDVANAVWFDSEKDAWQAAHGADILDGHIDVLAVCRLR